MSRRRPARRNIGVGMIDLPFHSGDAPLRVETPEGAREVTTTPFWDPEKKIPRASLR